MRSTAQYGGDLVTLRNVMFAPRGTLQPSMGEILSHDVTLLTCRQKIIVKVNIMGEICDITLRTCPQKIIVKANIMGEIF